MYALKSLSIVGKRRIGTMLNQPPVAMTFSQSPNRACWNIGLAQHWRGFSIISALGTNLKKLPGQKNAHNCDIWIAKDGTIWIGTNNSGGKQEQTALNLYTLFPNLQPKSG